MKRKKRRWKNFTERCPKEESRANAACNEGEEGYELSKALLQLSFAALW